MARNQSEKRTPHPGSTNAFVRGCTCPRTDNHYGHGRFGDGGHYGWIVSASCPLHNTKAALKIYPHFAAVTPKAMQRITRAYADGKMILG